MLAAGRQFGQWMDAAAQMRRIVDVAVLDYVIWMLQRSNVE
jgi:hypothetical protein